MSAMSAKVYAAAVIQGDRERQEDYHRFYPVPAGGAVLAVLADGMGGHPGGAEAAKVAVDAFVDAYQVAEQTTVAPQLSDDMLQAANAAIAEEARNNKQLAGMGCTLVAALIGKSEMQWISVGDSLLYLFVGGRLQKLNADHTIGGVLDKEVREGKTTPEEAAQMAPMRHALYSVLTGGRIRLVDSNSIDFDSDGAFVVAASDGLLSLAHGEIESCLCSLPSTNAQAAAEELIKRVKSARAAGQDNATVLVVEADAIA